MAQITQPFPCTNVDYKDEDVENSDSWWWSRHEDVPKKWQVVCLYPIHPDGLIEQSENYVMPDLGKVNINSLSAEARQRAEFLIAHYGADNMISLAMREFAEQYGYKPYEQALFDTKKQFKQEVLVEAFKNNPQKAIERYKYLFEEHEINIDGLLAEDKPSQDYTQTQNLSL